MFFNRFRFSILRRLVNHNQTSSMTCREVVVATPTTQTTMALLDIFRFVAYGILIGCCVLNFVIPLFI
jgi:hypothetical protein